jgi:hypothetical protein
VGNGLPDERLRISHVAVILGLQIEGKSTKGAQRWQRLHPTGLG